LLGDALRAASENTSFPVIEVSRWHRHAVRELKQHSEQGGIAERAKTTINAALLLIIE
jgi:hypothetical protein